MGPDQSADTYSKFALYYDAYVGKFNLDIPLYLHLAEGGSHILEIGCGTGRVLKPLLEKGHRVTGVDISAEMLNVAGRKLSPHITSGQLDLVEHNFCTSALKGVYDKILITFYTFNYLISSIDCDNFVRNVYKVLSPGGIVAADLFYPAPLLNPEQAGKWTSKKFAMHEREIMLYDRRDMLGDIEKRVQRYVDGDRVDEIVTERRFFDKANLEEMLSRADYKNIRFADGYSINGLHRLIPGEKATGSFIVLAGK